MSLRDILIWIRAQLVKEKNDSQGGGGGVLGLSIYGTFWDLSHIWLSIKQIESMLYIMCVWKKKKLNFREGGGGRILSICGTF